MTRSRRRSAWCLGALLGLSIASCGTEPTAVVTGLEIVIAEGDQQFGTVGQLLGTPLRAVVRTQITQAPQENVSVRWEVQQGGATLESSANTTTDETGSVEARVRLGGSAPTEVTVRATVVDQPSASAVFTLHTVEPPELESVSPTAAAAGDTITLTGANFSPTADQNVVLFSGVRGRVISSTGSQLTVEVPRCLPPRPVSVTVLLGAIASGAQTLTVTTGGVISALSVGEVLDITDAEGLDCYRLTGGMGVQYLVIAQSASTVGAAMHPFELTVLSSTSMVASPDMREGPAPSIARLPLGDPQALLDERVRTLEGELIARERGTVSARPTPSPAAAGAPPTVGDTRTFSVWAGSTYSDVTAVAEYVGSEAAIFVDRDAPAGGFTTGELQDFAARFDDVIHPEVTSVFGSPSDLDGNDRVIILFTPVVNGLTERGSSGFVGGFFFGNDLLPENNNSNAGEIFYSLVPDPTGIHSDPRSKAEVLGAVPAVLAHEFQHMVHFNERFLLLDAGQEALWLSEALAQMAEEVVARRYLQLGDPALADLFRSGAVLRAARYLAETSAVSLIVSTGQGTLAERGAGYLYLLYLADQEGIDLLGRLTRTTRRGVANVEAEVGRDWPGILSDWWAATYLDGSAAGAGRLIYPSIDLRSLIGAPFPLVPESLGPTSVTESGSLWSSSAAYYLLTPDASGSATVRLGGEAGGASSPQAALRLRIIRVS